MTAIFYGDVFGSLALLRGSFPVSSLRGLCGPCHGRVAARGGGSRAGAQVMFC